MQGNRKRIEVFRVLNEEELIKKRKKKAKKARKRKADNKEKDGDEDNADDEEGDQVAGSSQKYLPLFIPCVRHVSFSKFYT